jgi:hypothetical protein
MLQRVVLEHYMIICVGTMVLVAESDVVSCDAVSGLPRSKVLHSIVLSADWGY